MHTPIHDRPWYRPKHAAEPGPSFSKTPRWISVDDVIDLDSPPPFDYGLHLRKARLALAALAREPFDDDAAVRRAVRVLRRKLDG